LLARRATLFCYSILLLYFFDRAFYLAPITWARSEKKLG
jgi:hypothetical protein